MDITLVPWVRWGWMGIRSQVRDRRNLFFFFLGDISIQPTRIKVLVLQMKTERNWKKTWSQYFGIWRKVGFYSLFTENTIYKSIPLLLRNGNLIESGIKSNDVIIECNLHWRKLLLLSLNFFLVFFNIFQIFCIYNIQMTLYLIRLLLWKII